jgi:nucleoside-diphosphate-sugar epimerase
MRSIVLGATGVVGGHIVEQLLQAGEMPFALSRSPPTQDARNVCWIRGDLTDLSTLALPDFSTIYCTAHAGSLAAGLPRLVGPSVQRLVLFTSSSVVTKLNSDVAYEREGLQRLAAGEAATIAFCEARGIAWTVLRPTIIYDEGRDVNISRLARLIAKFGVLPLAGWGAGRRQPVHAQDLAVGALQAAASRAAWNKTYALPGGDTISYREMVGRIFDGLEKPRRIVPVPVAIWRVAFFLLQRWLPNANASMGTRMSKDMIFDARPAREDFGWNPRGFRPRFDHL